MEAAIGIIGLSIQVIDTSVKVKRVIDNYRTVSKDIRRLATKIDRAETICRAIKTQLKDGLTGSKSATTFQLLGPQVLRGISETLTELDKVVSEIEAKAGKKGGAKLLGVSFLKRKDTIQKLGQELDEDLIFLHSLMNTEVFSRVEAIHHKLEIAPLSQPRHDQGLTQSDRFQVSVQPISTAQTTVSEPKPKPKLEPKTQVKYRTSTQHKRWAFQFFTSTNSSKMTRQVTSELPIEIEKTAFSIGHKVSSYRIELVWGFGTFTSPWCSLRFPRDINIDEAGVLLEVFKTDNVVDFQRLLTSGRFSVETTIRGSNLFHFAWMFRGSDICRFLLQQGSQDFLEGTPTDTFQLFTNGSYGTQELGYPRNINDMLALTHIWMPKRMELSVVSDFTIAACLTATPKQLELCFDHFLPYAEYELEDLTNCAWDLAAGLFCAKVYMRSETESTLDDWKRLFRKILLNGNVDIHKLIPDPYVSRGQCSVMLCLLHQHSSPEILFSHIRIWLEVLRACNVQLQPYLKREYLYCRDNFDPGRPLTFWFHSGYGIEFCSETVCGLVVPFWRHNDDKTSPAYDVLKEFHHLRLIWSIFWAERPVLDHISGLCDQDRVRAWKQASQDDEIWVRQWPFFWPLYLEEPTPPDISIMQKKGVWSSFCIAAELPKRRFEKRWRKRFLKHTKDAVMPGSWFD